MKVQTQNFFTSLLLGFGLFAPWPQRKKVHPTGVKFAIINDPTGEAVFSDAGFNLAARFPANTWLGALTGDSHYDYVEVVTFDETETKEARIWVRKDKIRTVTGEQNLAAEIAAGTAINKHQEGVDKIFKAAGY